MSSPQSSKSTKPLQASLPIKFLIIGGGIAGLACALALRRVGHHALVLEKTSRELARGETGLRLPPNLTKIFFHWGLRDALLSKASVTTRLMFMRYESGEPLGEHVWDEDMLKETRGRFAMMSHGELYDILYDAATAMGAEVRFDAAVTDVDAEEREVTLATGETLLADVLVGADGEYGPSRKAVLGHAATGSPTGLAVYDTVIPMDKLPKSAYEFCHGMNGQFVAFGDGRAIVAYSIHHSKDVAFQMYAPDDDSDGRYGDEPKVNLRDVAGDLGELLSPTTQYARKAVRVSVRDHRDLEDWVSDDGRLVLIGEAAHPFPPSTIQGTAMAVEDGAVLAKLFSHLSSERQIESFLYAFQELRQARVRNVRAGEFSNVFFMTAAGPEATQRDDAMRAKAARGANVLEGDGEGGAEGLWDEYRLVFGYDCEDEADDWWVQWGMLRERAHTLTSADGMHARAASGGGARGDASPLLKFDFASAMTSVQVTSTEDC